MRRFAELWPDAEKVPSVMAQISWTAHRILLDRFADEPELYLWYASKAAENRWSVRHLGGQIDLKLYERQGSALTNFKLALEPGDAEQALHATKDPYIFEFLELAEDARERELEQALIDDVQKLLLELGTGFAFYGRQKALFIGDCEFFLDLLFYHHALRRFVIVELKVGEFKPEYVSKMNFYLNAVDEQLRLGDDRESVGIILCTRRDETIAKLALHRVYAPIAVSTWQADTPAPTLPPVEIADDVPADLGELSELETVRARLIDRVARRAPEIIDEDEKANQRR
jgi:predicted nuclease of restriction endonuclease-like (RecB) superfamily